MAHIFNLNYLGRTYFFLIILRGRYTCKCCFCSQTYNIYKLYVHNNPFYYVSNINKSLRDDLGNNINFKCFKRSNHSNFKNNKVERIIVNIKYCYMETT